MDFRIEPGMLLGLAGVGFSVASFLMKRMMALRVLAVVANVCFIGYGLSIMALPGLLLNAVLLPVNTRRIFELRRLTREISRATAESPVSQWLLPHMSRRDFKRGATLLRKGDEADSLIYIARGQVRAVEADRVVQPGELIGEIGVFSPERQRTQTLVCETDGELYEMTDEALFQIYLQQPKIGFYLMRLLVGRLLADVQRHAPPPAVIPPGPLPTPG